MARPTGWDILGLDGDPTPGVVESVQALAKEFGDFAHDVESAYRSLNSFGSDTAALQWVGQTADAFKSHYGPLPGRLQKLYTSYSEASDALSAYAPQLQAAQDKADSALRQAQDANVDLQRATTTANNAAADLKTAQQNHTANPNPQAVTDAQTAHDTAQNNLNNAKARMAALTAQANQAHDDRINAAKACAKAIGHAQHDGIHNKSWWQHLGEDLSEWGGEIGKIAGELAPVLMVVALATSWIPGVDVVTAALAEADNIIALAGTAMATVGDAMQGHWGDALLGVGMLGLAAVGAGGEGEALEGEAGALEGEATGAENAAEDATTQVDHTGSPDPSENAVGEDARTGEGSQDANVHRDPVDAVSGWMLTDATDVNLPGVLPLILRRAYASGYATGRLFGPGWASTLDQRLSVNAAGIHFAGDDAQRLDYPVPVPGQEVLPRRGARWPLAWDQDSDEIRITDPWSGHTRHFATVHYGDDTGQIRDLTAITDRNGNYINILRDEGGTPTAVEHAGYRVAIDTTVSPAGPRITALRLLDADAESGSTLKRFQYDERGRLTGVVNSSDLPFTYEWDQDNRISAWQDRSGYRYEYTYDHLGRVIRGEGEFLAGTFDYDPANRTTVVTDSLGNATTIVYDEHGHVCSETDSLGNTVLTETDSYGRILARTDALGATTRFHRDDNGDLRRLVAPDGTVTTVDYNEFHRPIAVTGPDGTTWRKQYDALGNLVAVIDPAGAVTRFGYSPAGALTAGTDALGAVTRFTNNAAGLVVAESDPLGNTTRAVRDAAGRVTQVVDPLGSVTSFEWDSEGLPASRTDPNGATIRWRHDANGRLVEVVDPIGAVTRFEPGPMGTLAARTQPDGVRNAYQYDSERNLVAVTNSDGATWNYTYDPARRLIGETDFIGRELSYSYDAAGHLVGRITGTGQEICLVRDVMGRVVARHTPEGEYGYSYDTAGRLFGATGPGASLEYEYDLLGRVLAETVDGRTMRYAYDAAGRRTRRVTASGAESGWTYDITGRPIELAAGTGSLAFAYDATGREVRRGLGGGGWLTRDYDLAGQLIAEQLGYGDLSEPHPVNGSEAMTADTILSRSWAWRADGVPEEIRDSLRGSRSFTSDSAGRVTAVSAHGWRETYAYDAYGNPTTNAADDHSGAAVGQAEPTITHRTLIQRSRRTSNEYDHAGRLVRTVRRSLDGRRKTWDYTWDSQDRLVQANTPDHGTWRYSYDPLGRRIGKHRLGPEGTVAEQVLFSWDGSRLAEQTTPADDGTAVTLTWDYDPGTFRPAAQRRNGRLEGADGFDQDLVDEVFYAIVTDLVGTPSELVTPDGGIAWHSTTTLWGRTVGVSAEPGLDCPLRFPGQYHDAETGLHYNLHRYYDPDSAAYLTPDPLGLAPSPNDHAYVHNPLISADPLGLYETTDEEPVILYRSPGEGNRASELNGLNAANHEGDYPTAYLSNKPEGAADYAGNGHDDGFHVFTMKPGFRERFGHLEYPLENKGGLPEGTTEWRISADDFDEFNSYIDHEKTEWWTAYRGWFEQPRR